MENLKNFDDFLMYIGTGKWNLLYFFSAGFLYIVWAPHSISGPFVTPVLNYTCLTPDNITRISEDSCTYIKTKMDGTEVEETCTDWEFDTSVFDSTLTSEFQLVCNRAYLRATYHGMYGFGNMLTCILWGYLADRYGRKAVIAASHVLWAVICVSMTFLPLFSLILAFRFLMGIMSNNTFYSLAMEVCEIKHRSLVGVLIGLPWALGTMAWGGMAYLIRDWRWLNLTVSLPFLLLIVSIYLMDESPRWLLVTGKDEKVLRVMRRAVHMNRVDMPPEEDIRELLQKTQEHQQKIKKKGLKLRCRCPKLLSTPVIGRITFSITAAQFISSLVFMGLNLSGGMLSNNPFLYLVMAGLMEVPGYTLTGPVINRWGRKVPIIVGFFICGACMLSVVLVPEDMWWLVMMLAMVGKLMVSGAYMILMVYQAEVQPTEVRLQGKGLSVMSASVALSIAPYITDLLGSVVTWLPSVIFGVTSLLVCVLVAPLPETVGVPLPETVEDLDALWKRKWRTSPAHV